MACWNCETCGKLFRSRGNRKRRFCSRTCGYKAGYRRIETREERFRKYCGPPSERGCIEWIGCRSPDGYGEFKWTTGVTIHTHRGAWLLFRGSIPDGVEVLHNCDNPPCVNLEHLRLDTHAENMGDMRIRLRGTRGSKHRDAKLVEADIVAIRQRYKSGERIKEIAADYPVDMSSINRIVHGKQWFHVPI